MLVDGHGLLAAQYARGVGEGARVIQVVPTRVITKGYPIMGGPSVIASNIGSP